MQVVLIGAGNLGFHLGQRLHQAGVEIPQVFSRNLDKASELAGRIQADPVNNLDHLLLSADLYILAVNDQSIPAVAKKLSTRLPVDRRVVHTSGATASTVLAPYFKRFGVFYPLQTFSREKEIDFTTIPLCIYANQDDDQQVLEDLAKRISDHVFAVSDEKRAVLHVAAVFVNNFVNHCYQIGHQIVTQEELPFKILFPLMQETLKKVENTDPKAVQTGPAIRGDKVTIRRHLDYLEEKHPSFAPMYRLLSNSINPSL